MPHILIIDDEPKVRLMLRKLFESQGYTVTEAADGNEGIKQYRADPADLIITDLIMPDKEGMETIVELKKDFPDIKIIAMSGGGKFRHTGYLDVAKRLGALQTFEKPIRRKELLDAVSQIVGAPTWNKD